MKPIVTLSLIATLGGSSLALAHGGREARFARMDADSDGRVTEQELLTHELERFDRADTDQDGVVTREERKTVARERGKQRGKRRFVRKDADGNGVLAATELPRMSAERFAALDKNDDGGLSADEMKAGHRGNGRRGKARGKRKHRPGKGHVALDREQVESRVAHRFAKSDTNKDGALTPDEMKGRRGHKRGHRGKCSTPAPK